MNPRTQDAAGFTLFEVLIVISIIGFLLTGAFMALSSQVRRGLDTKRKGNIQKMRVALEEYYNDNDCYPSAATMSTCGGNELAPYLNPSLCDPETRQPFLYVVDPAGSECRGYRMCAVLADTTDRDITKAGCSPTLGCGWGAAYTYCVASGVSPTAPGFTP